MEGPDLWNQVQDNALREPAALWETEGIGFRVATDYRRAQKKRHGPSGAAAVNGGRVFHQSPLKRMFQHRSELFYDNQGQGDEPEESNLDNLLEWFVSTGCCAHDKQKLLRWASSGLIWAD